MNFVFTELMSQVRVALDQNQQELTFLTPDENTLELDDIIRQKLLHAARWLLERAPLRMIDTLSSLVTEGTQTGDDGRYSISRPSDMLRLHTLKVSSWDIPVHDVLPADSEWGMVAASDFAGIRPNGQRPIVLDDGITLTLVGSSGTIQEASYIAQPTIVENDTTDNEEMAFPQLLVDALVYLAAGLVCDAYKEVQLGSVYKQTAIGLAQIEIPQEDKKR